MKRPSAALAAFLALDLALAGTLAAHPGGGVAPGELWVTWTMDPWTLGPIGLAASAYARGVGRLWGRAGVGRGVRAWQVWSYLGGILALLVALVSPLDALGGSLFSAHMVQHVVLMLVAAPLLVLGGPALPFLWSLPRGVRIELGRVARHGPVRGLWRVASHPLGAWSLHASAIWIWHVPALYQATLSSQAVHVAQHLSFFGTALLFWWAAWESARRRRRVFGVGVLYIFTTAVHGSVLGALLTFSTVLWYPAYADRTAEWGLTALEDQQLGGLLMWIPGAVVYLVAALALLALGLTRLERFPGGGRAGAGPAEPAILLERRG